MAQRGRPVQFDREAAVATAMNAFWRGGFEPSSVKALSEQMGITRSSFYNMFGSREALFKEVLGRYLEQSPDRMLADLPVQGSAARHITSAFKKVCAVLAADPAGRGCFAANSVGELCGGNKVLGAYVAEAMAERAKCLEALLSHAVKNGELPLDTDVAALALALQMFLVGQNLMMKAVRSEARLWQSCRVFLRSVGLLEET